MFSALLAIILMLFAFSDLLLNFSRATIEILARDVEHFKAAYNCDTHIPYFLVFSSC